MEQEQEHKQNALTSLAIDLVILVPLLVGEVKEDRLKLYKTLYDKFGNLKIN